MSRAKPSWRKYGKYGYGASRVLTASRRAICSGSSRQPTLYTALGRHYPAVISTLIYIAAILAATRNPMLGFVAIIVGAVCAFERRATGGVLAPMLTHFSWGLIMVLALPPIFGV